MLREGREKVGSATTGLIQEKKKKKKKPITVSNVNTVTNRVFLSRPRALEETIQKGTFLLSSQSTAQQTAGLGFVLSLNF